MTTEITEKCWPDDFGVHPLHCGDVLLGSYDVPWSPEVPPVILDVGANIGAFVKWSASRWPGSTILAYEPHPNNFKLLKRTVESIADNGKISFFELAVSGKAGTSKLKFGKDSINCGEWSLNVGSDFKDSVDVTVIAAKDLPEADILKLDVEGAEAEILEALKYRLHRFSAVMLEIHAAQWVKPIEDLLMIAGFAIVGKEVKFNSEHRVELKALKQSLMPRTN